MHYLPKAEIITNSLTFFKLVDLFSFTSYEINIVRKEDIL